MDPFTLKKLAGHADLNTTMRYVHWNDEDVRAAMEKAQGGTKIGTMRIRRTLSSARKRP